jgi:RNA polymerase sigma-70 factor (ECF subfamily)
VPAAPTPIGRPVFFSFGPAKLPSVPSPPADAEDLAIMRAVLAGDSEAFRTLIDKHGDSIFNLAYRMTGNAADAEDLAQEAFVQAYSRLADFRLGSRFHPWLYTIALNLCRNHLRRQAILRWVPLHRDKPGNSAIPEDLTASAYNPEEALLDQEAEERLHEAIATLPTKYREVFVLRQSEGLAYEEIAEVTGLPMGTVEARLFRARRLLLKALGAPERRRAK